VAIANYYHQRSKPAQAAKHYAFSGQYESALQLYLELGEKELDNAIEVVGKARNDALTHTLIDFLMGESDHTPKHPNYVYRLHTALGNYRQAANTALIIANQAQNDGNYKEAHELLFRTYQDLRQRKLPVPQELWRRLSVIHSYIIVKRLAKCGNHTTAALMLLRVANSIHQFPKHTVSILTSTVIECQRAKLFEEAYNNACTLMREEYRSQVADNYKKKIENIVRKQQANGEKDVKSEQPCVYCGFQMPESQLCCPDCKNISPFCIGSGLRMTAGDWSQCPSCEFPAKRTVLLQYAEDGESCPMCDAPLQVDKIIIVVDPAQIIADQKTIFQPNEQSNNS